MAFRGVLTSPENVLVKYVRTLEKKRVRDREKRFLLEGRRLVAHAMERGCIPELVFYTEVFSATAEGRALVERVAAAGGEIRATAPEVMRVLSDTLTPPGIVAIVPLPQHDPSLVRDGSLALVLDNVRDPGNLGTILRTAQATHVWAVLLTAGCADPFAPKVVRAGMGAHFGLPIFPGLAWDTITALTDGKERVLADARGSLDLWEVDWRPPVALIVGGETQGASPEACSFAAAVVRLPMAEEVESLNAAVATAAFLFEIERQRATTGAIR